MGNNNRGKAKAMIKHFFTLIKVHIYQILYMIVLIGLWVYIIINWNKCISMKFFEQFDGNNILFLFGIVWVVLFFYDVEAKGFKFQRKKNITLSKELRNAEIDFQRNQLSVSSEQDLNIETDGGNNNE